MSATVRRLVRGDLGPVVELERLVFADPWSRRAFESAFEREDQAGFVAVSAGHLAGYGICSAVADEGEIQNLAVSPGLRGKGLGRQLVGAMVEWLAGRGARTVYLEVRSSNLAAIELYRSLGFATRGVRKGYYQRPREDAVTMGMTIGSRE